MQLSQPALALQALRSARGAGIDVNVDVVERALEYVRLSQNGDGSFSYALRDRRSSPGLTAAAVATLHAFGKYGQQDVEDSIQRGMDYLARYDYQVEEQLYWYNAFYMAQALWFDLDHPTSKVHEIYGAAALAAMVPEPSSMALMGLAVVLGVLAGRRAIVR